jgi:hypothetical protein
MYEKSITKTFDAMGPEGDLLLATNPGQSLVNLHPTPVQIFQLWQMFLDNVQQQVLDATTNLEEVPKNTEALMFGIYCMATVAMSESDCQKLFKQSRAIVQERFQVGARLALQNASYLKSTDITVLQGFVLYLVSHTLNASFGKDTTVLISMILSSSPPCKFLSIQDHCSVLPVLS